MSDYSPLWITSNSHALLKKVLWEETISKPLKKDNFRGVTFYNSTEDPIPKGTVLYATGFHAESWRQFEASIEAGIIPMNCSETGGALKYRGTSRVAIKAGCSGRVDYTDVNYFVTIIDTTDKGVYSTYASEELVGLDSSEGAKYKVEFITTYSKTIDEKVMRYAYLRPLTGSGGSGDLAYQLNVTTETVSNGVLWTVTNGVLQLSTSSKTVVTGVELQKVS